MVGWLTGAGGVRLRSFHWDVPDPRGGVLLVHGFGDHTGRYHDVAWVLGARGYSVLAYDQRGHGSSEGPRGHADRFDLYLADLDGAWAETARRLSGPCFLYAHSFGGLAAMRWLQTRSSRPAAVVLSAPRSRLEAARCEAVAARPAGARHPERPQPAGAPHPGPEPDGRVPRGSPCPSADLGWLPRGGRPRSGGRAGGRAATGVARPPSGPRRRRAGGRGSDPSVGAPMGGWGGGAAAGGGAPRAPQRPRS